MSRRVAGGLALVVATGHHPAVDHHHRADGHLAGGGGRRRLLEGDGHGAGIVHVHRRRIIDVGHAVMVPEGPTVESNCLSEPMLLERPGGPTLGP